MPPGKLPKEKPTASDVGRTVLRQVEAITRATRAELLWLLFALIYPRLSQPRSCGDLVRAQQITLDGRCGVIPTGSG